MYYLWIRYVETYVFEPGKLVHFRISPDWALEVDIVTLFDIIGIQGLAHFQSDYRLILHVQSPLVLQSAARNNGILRSTS